tara:strand:+ start:1729 stop:2145 length:417 start_codon:yes stop_codon:yes gene_type:complete
MVVQDKNKKAVEGMVALVYAGLNNGTNIESKDEVLGITSITNIGKPKWGLLYGKKGIKNGQVWFAPSLSNTLPTNFKITWLIQVIDLDKNTIASLASSSFVDSVSHKTHTSIFAYKRVSVSYAVALGFSQEAIDKCLA